MTQGFDVTTATSDRRAAREAGQRESSLTLGRWQLVQPLGEGAWTTVHQARPLDAPDRAALYAVKQLRQSFENDPRAVGLLQREAMVGQRVAHPRLVAVLAAHVHHPPYYLVMPYLPGGTLSIRLARTGRLAVPEALWIARQVAEALGAMHADGWLHGDVKPDNVIVSPEGHATLLDLGFCRRIGQRHASSVRGTPHYLAPEALTAGQPLEACSDLYALGAMLLEMLTGRVPFSGRDRRDLLTSVRAHPAPDLRRVRPGVHTGVAELVASLLAKQPLRRPRTADEVVERLTALEIATFADR